MEVCCLAAGRLSSGTHKVQTADQIAVPRRRQGRTSTHGLWAQTLKPRHPVRDVIRQRPVRQDSTSLALESGQAQRAPPISIIRLGMSDAGTPRRPGDERRSLVAGLSRYKRTRAMPLSATILSLGRVCRNSDALCMGGPTGVFSRPTLPPAPAQFATSSTHDTQSSEMRVAWASRGNSACTWDREGCFEFAPRPVRLLKCSTLRSA